jgi:hypothetical protein
MIGLEMYGTTYEIIDSWEDLTVDDFIELQKVVDKAPKKLKKIIELRYTGDQEGLDKIEISTREREKTFPKFYGDFILATSNMTKKEMSKVMSEDREFIFLNYLYQFAVGCLYAPMDVPDYKLDYFDFECKEDESVTGRYMLPKTKEVAGVKRPFGYMQTIQYTESSDLKVYMIEHSKGDYSLLKNIISVICLKDGEEYDEDVCLNRAKHFGKLKMHIVWDVFFYLYGVKLLSQSIISPSSLQKAQQNNEQPIKLQG